MSRGGYNPMFIGLFSSPGPAAPLKAVPFGQDSWCKDEFGLTEAQLAVVVALLASEMVGAGLATINELTDFTGVAAQACMAPLVRGRWVEQAGRVDKSREKLWCATRRARQLLFPDGWRSAA